MKITIVGNMCTWTKELSTSYILNDDTLVDVPQGSFKTLYNEYNLENIKNIFITHFHSDHFADLHLVLDVLINRYNKDKINILGPKGCRDRLVELAKILDTGKLAGFIDEHVNFFESKHGAIFKIGNYKIKTYAMTHKMFDAYGFTIEDKDGIKVGFSGDSCICNSVHKIIKNSKAIFIDCASVNMNNAHLSVQEVLDLKSEYPKTSFYPVHFSYESKALALENGLIETYQGQVVNIKKD